MEGNPAGIRDYLLEKPGCLWNLLEAPCMHAVHDTTQLSQNVLRRVFDRAWCTLAISSGSHGMRIRIEPVGERGVVQAPFHLFGTMKREGNWYIARCPPVDVRLLREERLLKRNKISLKQRSFSSLAASSAALWIKR